LLNFSWLPHQIGGEAYLSSPSWRYAFAVGAHAVSRLKIHGPLTPCWVQTRWTVRELHRKMVFSSRRHSCHFSPFPQVVSGLDAHSTVC
jgi:hypothetical protein